MTRSLPVYLRDRWKSRTEVDPGHGVVYWHILLRDFPALRATVRNTQDRLSHFDGLHMTPGEWLHVTTLAVGPTDEISAEKMTMMTSAASRKLSTVEPVPVTVGRVLYHPEAIALGIGSAQDLVPVREAVQCATRQVTGGDGEIHGSAPEWIPHITVAYSTTEQAAGPIVATLGKEVPACDMVVDAVSLVIQWGPERTWDWEIVESVPLRMTTDLSAGRADG